MSKRRAPRPELSDSEADEDENVPMDMDLVPPEAELAFADMPDEMRVEIIMRLLARRTFSEDAPGPNASHSALATSRAFYAATRAIINEQYQALMGGLRRDILVWGGRMAPGPDIVGRVRAFERQTGVTLERAVLLAPSAGFSEPWWRTGGPLMVLPVDAGGTYDMLVNTLLSWLNRNAVPTRNGQGQEAVDNILTRRLWQTQADPSNVPRLHTWSTPRDTHYGFAQTFYLARQLMRARPDPARNSGMETFFRQLVQTWAVADPAECITVLLVEATRSRDIHDEGARLASYAVYVILWRLLSVPEPILRPFANERERIGGRVPADLAERDRRPWELFQQFGMTWFGFGRAVNGTEESAFPLDVDPPLISMLLRIDGQRVWQLYLTPEERLLMENTNSYVVLLDLFRRIFPETRQLALLLSHRPTAFLFGAQRLPSLLQPTARSYRGVRVQDGDLLARMMDLARGVAGDTTLPMPPADRVVDYSYDDMITFLNWFPRALTDPALDAHGEAVFLWMQKLLAEIFVLWVPEARETNTLRRGEYGRLVERYVLQHASPQQVLRLVRGVSHPGRQAPCEWLAGIVSVLCRTRLPDLTEHVWRAESLSERGRIVLDPRIVGWRAIWNDIETTAQAAVSLPAGIARTRLWHPLPGQRFGGGVLGYWARVAHALREWRDRETRVPLMQPEHWVVLRTATRVGAFGDRVVHPLLQMLWQNPDAAFSTAVGDLLLAEVPRLLPTPAQWQQPGRELVDIILQDLQLFTQNHAAAVAFLGTLPAQLLALTFVLNISRDELQGEGMPVAVADVTRSPITKLLLDLQRNGFGRRAIQQADLHTLLHDWLPWVRDAVAILPGAVQWDDAMAREYMRALWNAEVSPGVTQWVAWLEAEMRLLWPALYARDAE